MGQHEGGVFFMLTVTQPAYSFIQPQRERAGSPPNFFTGLTLV